MKRKSSIAAVLATRGAKDKLPNVEMAAYSCGGCKHTFAVQASLAQPFCISCGAGELKRVTSGLGKIQALSKVADKDLMSVVCASCNAHNAMSVSLARTLDGRMNCVTCGTAISFPVDDDNENDNQGDDETAFTTGTGPESSDKHMPESYMDDDEALSSTEYGDGDEGDEDGDEDGDGEDDDTTSGSQVSYTDWDEPTAEPMATAADGDDDADDDADFGGDDIGDDDDSALSDDESEDEGDGQTETIATLYTIRNPKKARVLFASISPNVVVAFANGIQVGHLRKRKETAGVFGNTSFMQSLEVSVARHGLKKTLSQYGFELTKVRVNRGEAIRQQVAAGLAEEGKKMRKNFEQSSKVFQQCMAIAASGMTRDVFADKGNPLKSSLFDALSGLGVRNPSRVIQAAFSEAGDEYHKVLLEIATDLMQKPEDVRNQLAKSLCDLKPLVGDDEQDSIASNDGDGDDDDMPEDDVTMSGTDGDDDEGDEGDEGDMEGSSFEVRASMFERRLSTPVVATPRRNRASETAGTAGTRRPIFQRRVS